MIVLHLIAWLALGYIGAMLGKRADNTNTCPCFVLLAAGPIGLALALFVWLAIFVIEMRQRSKRPANWWVL